MIAPIGFIYKYNYTDKKIKKQVIKRKFFKEKESFYFFGDLGVSPIDKSPKIGYTEMDL